MEMCQKNTPEVIDICRFHTYNTGKAWETNSCARWARKYHGLEIIGSPVYWHSCPFQVEGGPRTIAAARDLEMEGMNLNMGREREEEEETREDWRSKDSAKNKKVHRIVSKWMLPEESRITYLERANCCPPPVFIISISLAELAVFIYYAVWKPQKQWITLDSGILDSPFIYCPDKREEVWRFISYMLVHAGIYSSVNLTTRFQPMDSALPQFQSRDRRENMTNLLPSSACFCNSFLVAGTLAGSLASSIFDPLRSLVGASGGVYALMGGYFMNVLVNFREMIPAFGIFRLLIIILIILSDMGFALYRRFFVPANGSPVSFAAHIAGGFAGMSIGYTVFSSFDKALLKDPRFWIAIAAYLACVLFAVFFNIFLSPAN
ncbi:rhomboid-related protein 2 [Otolemur garnettii]|uniref:rhomboid-related protein 2 n=1 Tax=Otolemur garnettii TaxID=30611 RepID=UPI000644282F|nr:rhomboid-related protein 2 [Otolemur garnettii]